MSRIDKSTPVSPTLDQLYNSQDEFRKTPVNKRVFYLNIQAVATVLRK